MCLDKTHVFPKISRKPITVYKIFAERGKRPKKLITPFTGYSYKIGDTIKAIKPWYYGILPCCIEEEGVHAYCSKPTELDISIESRRKRGYYICEIPPFTPYWIGNFDQIAASKMKIIKRL
jgi:hypothetical protein